MGIMAWNVNGMNTHRTKIHRLLRKLGPDVIILKETRRENIIDMNIVWPVTRMEQIQNIYPRKQEQCGDEGDHRPGSEELAEEFVEIVGKKKKNVARFIKVKVPDKDC